MREGVSNQGVHGTRTVGASIEQYYTCILCIYNLVLRRPRTSFFIYYWRNRYVRTDTYWTELKKKEILHCVLHVHHFILQLLEEYVRTGAS